MLNKKFKSISYCLGVEPQRLPLHRPLSISKSLETQGRKTGQHAESLQRMLLSQTPSLTDVYTPLKYADNYRKYVGAANDSSSGGDSDDVFGQDHYQIEMEMNRVSENRHAGLRRMETIDSAVTECSTFDPTDNKEIGSR